MSSQADRAYPVKSRSVSTLEGVGQERVLILRDQPFSALKGESNFSRCPWSSLFLDWRQLWSHS